MFSQDLVTNIACYIGAVIGLGIGVIVGAVILRAAAKWAEKMDLPFWSSAVTVTAYSLANIAIASVAAVAAGMMGSDVKHGLLQGLIAPVGFVTQSAIISGRHHVSFGKGIKISLFMWLVVGVIAVGVGAILAAGMLVMPRF